MRYSQLFGKTVRSAPSDATTVSHKLLFQAGFVRESTAGRYYFLPLGMRVYKKIINIIKEEMDKAGAQELLTPVMHPLELWKETNRNKETGFELTVVEDRRGAKFALGGTAEEMMVDLARKFQLTYRDLPFNIYQFSQKFRDELRARGGLLRVREFMMKDAYSFHQDEKSFKEEYQRMWKTYTRIFKRVGLETVVVESDNGYIGGDYCHEFVVESPIGESKYLMADGGGYVAHEEVAKFRRVAVNPDEKIKPFKIAAQPEWVQTMDDFSQYYKLPKKHFLKNVVYKNRVTGEIIIAVIRGDLEVNKVKLEHVLKAVGQLEDAKHVDLVKLGTKSGYVHSWGHKGVKYIGDTSLTTVRNFIGGQKEIETDSVNVNYGRDFECEKLADIAKAAEGDLTEEGVKLTQKRGIEVGNIFQLGYHYSNKMRDSVFTDQKGEKRKFYMGCYGIGIGRTMATVVEKHHDQAGIVWPEAIAPYQVHLVVLNTDNPEVVKRADEVYMMLCKKGIEVLYDDRDTVSAGVKFGDADLIGIPTRIVISAKTGEKLEVKKRGEKEAKTMSIEEAIRSLT